MTSFTVGSARRKTAFRTCSSEFTCCANAAKRASAHKIHEAIIESGFWLSPTCHAEVGVLGRLTMPVASDTK